MSNGGDLDKLGACKVYDDTTIPTYSFTNTISDFTYTLNSGVTANKPWETTFGKCASYTESYAVTYEKDGSAISKPAWLTLDTTLGASFLIV